jgi:hypothetical protein
MENALKLAKAFRQKKHFSNEAWLNRGLNPSPSDVCSRLTLLLIRSTDQFIAAIEAQASPDELRAVLKKGLDSFSESYFDTEEKEYICELIYELGQMVDLNISYEANSFLYGPELATMLMKQNDRKAVEILEFTCTKCATPLRIHIMQKAAGIPAGWVIASCNTCQELNLLDFKEGVKEMKFENYESKKTLSVDDLSKKEVIKLFNKMKNT